MPLVQLMVLNHTTSVYSQIRRYAETNEGWLRHNDGEIYPLKAMLTPMGLAGIKSMTPHWLSQQTAVFTPRAADKGDTVDFKCTVRGCTLSLLAGPPSTYAIWVKTDDTPAKTRNGWQ